MFNLLQSITEALSMARNPAVLCSFGSDSTLLLHFARQARHNLPVYYFGDELPEMAQQLVLHDDLTIFTYAPADRYLVPLGEGVALIDEYAINGQRVPMVSRVTGNAARGICTAESNHPRTPSFYFPHDVVLWGYRAADRNELIPTTFAREIQLGETRFIASLYDLTTDQVLNALDVLDLDYVGDDDAELCDTCLNTVLHSNWDRQAALAGFRARFDFSH